MLFLFVLIAASWKFSWKFSKIQKDSDGGYQSRLTITGQEESPVEIAQGGLVIRREDLKTTHEEADTIIVAQAIYTAKVEGKHVVVMADDTDVYILLL